MCLVSTWVQWRHLSFIFISIFFSPHLIHTCFTFSIICLAFMFAVMLLNYFCISTAVSLNKYRIYFSMISFFTFMEFCGPQ